MLTSVNSIRELGIVHSDLKPANFLFVQGELKLIDFGIARAIAPESTSIIRDTQMGTWNYISPWEIGAWNIMELMRRVRERIEEAERDG